MENIHLRWVRAASSAGVLGHGWGTLSPCLSMAASGDWMAGMSPKVTTAQGAQGCYSSSSALWVWRQGMSSILGEAMYTVHLRDCS